MRCSIVLGVGFGDEGKGRTVSYLTSLSESPLVVRFSGGHQAGHTVMHEGNKHIFSHFGSGTLQGHPTYWSKFCTVYPVGLINEWNALKNLKVNPLIKIDPLCPVTTPYDILFNRYLENKNNHGSCGVGVGTTIERHENYYKLYFMDLFNDKILKIKLSSVFDYYNKIAPSFTETINLLELQARLDRFHQSVDVIRKNKIGMDEITSCDHIIFEGSQGILLDQDFGFFPNVTRAKTDMTNVYEIIKDMKLKKGIPQINKYYVSRLYQTRHGNGYMSDERELNLHNNEQEINKFNSSQGHFRTGYLDLDLLKYSIEISSINQRPNVSNNLVLTCLDQVEDKENINVIYEGQIKKVSVFDIGDIIGVNTPFYSNGPKTFQTFINNRGHYGK